MKRPVLGPAPVVDFDGTIVPLPVDWPHLRRSFGVSRINDLWTQGGQDGFSLIAEMEVEGANVGGPFDAVMNELASATAFPVLASNSAVAVKTFFSLRTRLCPKSRNHRPGCRRLDLRPSRGKRTSLTAGGQLASGRQPSRHLVLRPASSAPVRERPGRAHHRRLHYRGQPPRPSASGRWQQRRVAPRPLATPLTRRPGATTSLERGR